ncbi:MAG: hypothetical protein ABI862_15930, partial [Ilumatobacteraceae bacterium]
MATSVQWALPVPSLSDQPNGPTQMLALANAIETAVNGRYAPLSFNGVILTDAAQTIVTGTGTDITWGTEVSDVDGWTSGGSATLTVPAGAAGIYVCTYSGSWNLSTASGTATVLINGVAAYVGN